MVKLVLYIDKFAFLRYNEQKRRSDKVKHVFMMQMGDGGVRARYTRGSQMVKGREFHLYHELLLLLEGEAELITDEGCIPLMPKTLVVIPRECFHQILLHGSEQDYCRCVLRIEHTSELAELLDSKLERVCAMEADREIQRLFEYLINAFSRDFSPTERTCFLQAIATLVLLELKKQPEQRRSEDANAKHFRSITHAALCYINDHEHEMIKIEQIAAALHVSRSYLCHAFREDLHIPIHSYILKKRLVSAHQRILMGESPTEAANQCGFFDYSGFYKQYVKMFGTSPSKRTKSERG